MSRMQTGPRLPCEEVPGKKQNCNSFGEYEGPNTSPTAAMCNGGSFKGDWYNECPVKIECKTRTLRAQQTPQGRFGLPVLHEPKPFGSSRSQVVASTPNIAEFMRDWGGMPASLMGLPSNIPTKSATQGGKMRGLIEPHQIPYPLPYPVKPPEEYPSAMQTQYAGPQPVMSGGVTPTFLPDQGEGIFSRLAKNVAQGWVGSTGWHVFDYARTVDMFGRKPNE